MIKLSGEIIESVFGGKKELSVSIKANNGIPTRYSMFLGRDTKANRNLANRFMRAIATGVVLTNPRVVKDIKSKEYVTFDVDVSGRYLNSQLQKLGF